MASRKRIEKRLETSRERLDLYYRMEAQMLADPVQSYTIGSRSLSKYGMSLADLRNAISELEEEIAELEAELSGFGRRAGRAIVIKDW